MKGWRLVDYLVYVLLQATTVDLMTARIAPHLDDRPDLLQGAGIFLVILLSVAILLGFVLILRRFRGVTEDREGGTNGSEP